MGRRGRTWTDEDRVMWDEVFTMTAPERNEAIKKAQRMLAVTTVRRRAAISRHDAAPKSA
jgi:hypothetical protein